MKVKEESEKSGLKLNIQKTKITASCPKTSWQIEGGKVEAVTDFIFLGSKITADDDWSHERCLLLGRKAMTNLNSILKSRDITLSTKVQIVNAGFPGGSEVKASACNAGDLGSIPGLGSSPGEGNGNPLQYPCPENPMDTEA